MSQLYSFDRSQQKKKKQVDYSKYHIGNAAEWQNCVAWHIKADWRNAWTVI